tara:strand:- start:26 stop:289 length:264 start_codon:yes stop_codon:yes gene_type:complete
MEEVSKDRMPGGDGNSYILRFKANERFTIILEFPCMKDLEVHRERIEEAGLECEQLDKFNVKFDQADMCLDLRNPHTAADFDIEDFL